jgi:NADH-quinone oxidoreductase subunit J
VISEFLFNVFGALALLSSLPVVFGRQPVHAALFLVFVFLNAAAMFVLLGAEFIAMMFMVVYVGAVAVLFLFVLMMLDINVSQIKRNVQAEMPLILCLGAAFAAELGLLATGKVMSTVSEKSPQTEPSVISIYDIGHVLYTDYAPYFQMSGAVLLVAMIGAIVLTLRHREGVKRQDTTEQVLRGTDGVTLVNPLSGAGLGGRQ